MHVLKVCGWTKVYALLWYPRVMPVFVACDLVTYVSSTLFVELFVCIVGEVCARRPIEWSLTCVLFLFLVGVG